GHGLLGGLLRRLLGGLHLLHVVLQRLQLLELLLHRLLGGGHLLIALAGLLTLLTLLACLGTLLHRLGHLLGGLRHLLGVGLGIGLRLALLDSLLDRLLHLLHLLLGETLVGGHLLHERIGLLLKLLGGLLAALRGLLHQLGHLLRLLLSGAGLLELLLDLLLHLRILCLLLEGLGHLLHLAGHVLLLLVIKLVEILHRLLQFINGLGKIAPRHVAAGIGYRALVLDGRNHPLQQPLALLGLNETGVFRQVLAEGIIGVLQCLHRLEMRPGGVLGWIGQQRFQLALGILDLLVIPHAVGDRLHFHQR